MLHDHFDAAANAGDFQDVNDVQLLRALHAALVAEAVGQGVEISRRGHLRVLRSGPPEDR